MKTNSRVVSLLLFLLFFTQCSAELTSFDGSDEDIIVGIVNTEVGTNVGNPQPTTQTKSSISFALADLESTAEDSDVDFSEEILCAPSLQSSIYFATQECYFSPSHYQMGILAVYLAECVTDSGEVAACTQKDISSVAQRVALYEGKQIDLDIDAENGSVFSSDLFLNADQVTALSAGGVQVVLSFVGGTIPAEADTVSYLQGKSYRMCTTPDESLDAQTMLERCGNSEAQFGDILIDLDSDGIYGFIDPDLLSEDSALETVMRPEKYDVIFQQNLASTLLNKDSAQSSSVNLTDTEFYDVAGYYAPIMGLKYVLDVDSTETHAYQVDLDITRTLKFYDGAADQSGDGNVCTQASTAPCTFDDDPNGLGGYNPFYDAAFIILPPQSIVSID